MPVQATFTYQNRAAVNRDFVNIVVRVGAYKLKNIRDGSIGETRGDLFIPDRFQSYPAGSGARQISLGNELA